MFFHPRAYTLILPSLHLPRNQQFIPSLMPFSGSYQVSASRSSFSMLRRLKGSFLYLQNLPSSPAHVSTLCLFILPWDTILLIPAQVGLEFMILSPQPSVYQNYRFIWTHESSCMNLDVLVLNWHYFSITLTCSEFFCPLRCSIWQSVGMRSWKGK